MKIKKILNQHRRDFNAVYECEHCGDEVTSGGYDDANFHNNVIPKMICGKCGRQSPDTYEPRGAVYPEGMQV